MELNVTTIVELSTDGTDASNEKSVDLRFFNRGIVLIAPGVFDKFSLLQDLNLRENRITELPQDIFHSLKELRVINLQKNKLTALHPNLFQENQKLRAIRVWGNEITHLDGKLFRNLPELKMLFFGGNRITTFDFGCLKTSTKLRILYFSFTDLSEISELDNFNKLLPALEVCAVNNNNFSRAYLRSVITTLEEQGIEIYLLDKSKGIKDGSVYGIKCVPDDIYLARQKRALEEAQLDSAGGEGFRDELANNMQETLRMSELLRNSDRKLEDMWKMIQEMEWKQQENVQLIKTCDGKLNVLEMERDLNQNADKSGVYLMDRAFIWEELSEITRECEVRMKWKRN